MTPWAAVRILKPQRERPSRHGDARILHAPLPPSHGRASAPAAACAGDFSAAWSSCCSGSMSLFYIGFVKVKMLPFDNKSEFQVIIDMPNGTTLEETARVAAALAEEAAKQPEVVERADLRRNRFALQLQRSGRHYYLRRGPNVADIQVNLLPKDDRKLQSHEIAKQVRLRLDPIAAPLRRAHQSRRSAARPAGARNAGRRSLRPEPRPAASRSPGIFAISSSAPTASSMSTGTWRTTSRSTVWCRQGESRAKRNFDEISPHAADRLQRVSQTGLLHVGSEKEDVPLTVRLDRVDRGPIWAALAEPGSRGRAGPGRPGEVHVDQERRRQEHLSQEPDAGDLRHRRHRGRDGEPGLRGSQARPGDRQDQDPGRLPDRAVHGRAALRCRRATR